MSPRPLFAAALACTGIVALAGCHPARIGQGRNHADKPMTVADRLDCPESQGDLTRTQAAADGRTCTYTGPEGRTVTLQYLALDGRPAGEALKGVESGLQAKVPAAPGAPPSNGLGAPPSDKPLPKPDWNDGKTASAEAKADTDPDDADGDKAVAAGSHRGGHDGHDHVHINLPGIHIDADDGDAHIRAFGQTVDADRGGHAVVTGGWNGSTHEVVATDGGVRMRYGFVGDKAVDATFLLASDQAGPSGDHAAAYVARGPAAGPLVLATMAMTGGDTHNRHDKLDDLKALVDRNVRR